MIEIMSSKRNHLKELSFLRKRRRENKVKRKIRIRRSQRKGLKRSKLPKRHNPYTSAPRPIPLDVPKDFSIRNNADDVMSFVNRVYNNVKNDSVRKTVFFNLYNVQSIDNGAISLLLALTNAIGKKNCWVNGNFPKNDISREVFMNSGFFDHVNSLLKKSKEKDGRKRNLIIEAGSSKTKNDLVGAEIRKVMKYLTTEEVPYRPVYSIIQEICGNSVEHANEHEQNKNWFISFVYERDKVVFTMIDIGKGILGTLRKKTNQELRDALFFKDPVAVLKGIFAGKYQSATWEHNRNKGLPKIHDYQTKGYISNLLVLTNKVYLDLESNKSHVMRTNFHGTFYTWTLNIINIQQWNKRQISA